MPTTTFRPQLDSLVIEQDLPLDPITKERIRELISQTIPKTISTLRPSYGALLDEYCDPKRLLNGVGGETPGYYGQSTMLAFAALDYFNSKLAYKPSPGLTSQQGVKQRAFFANRLLAAVEQNIADLAVWMTVLHTIPENWFPESLLRCAIEREIAQIGIYQNPVIEFDLQLPVKGGSQWLKQKTLAEWDTLKAYINDGKPWPIALIRKQTRLDFYADETVVVYAYQQTQDMAVTLLVYDTLRPWFEHCINLDFSRPNLVTQESSAGIEKPPIAGFVCKHYQTVRPPLTGWRKIFAYLFPWRLLWRIKRWWSLRKLNARSV